MSMEFHGYIAHKSPGLNGVEASMHGSGHFDNLIKLAFDIGGAELFIDSYDNVKGRRGHIENFARRTNGKETRFEYYVARANMPRERETVERIARGEAKLKKGVARVVVTLSGPKKAKKADVLLEGSGRKDGLPFPACGIIVRRNLSTSKSSGTAVRSTIDRVGWEIGSLKDI